MIDDTSPDVQSIERIRKAREKWYYPVQRTKKIAEGDWQRWIRAISNIPSREALFLDVALFFFGLAIPSLVSAIVTVLGVTQQPVWDSIVFLIFLVVGVVTLVAGFVCLIFDRRMKRIASSSVEVVLQDMKEVYERSARSEEMAVSDRSSPSAVPKIG